MVSRYLNPANDVAFKKLFGTEDHKFMLISFLNAALKLEGQRKIKGIELLPQEQVPLNRDSKTSILDVRCTDERNYQ
ncbi:MAG: PD-(D/E)XK nuclease family transposase [Chlamydiota bacterium]